MINSVSIPQAVGVVATIYLSVLSQGEIAEFQYRRR